MVVIGFFQNFFTQLPIVFNFLVTPLKELNPSLNIAVIGDLSIMGMFGVGIGATLITFLVIHIIRLFVGG